MAQSDETHHTSIHSYVRTHIRNTYIHTINHTRACIHTLTYQYTHTHTHTHTQALALAALIPGWSAAIQLRSGVAELRFQTRMVPSNEPENSTPALAVGRRLGEVMSKGMGEGVGGKGEGVGEA